MTLMIKYRIKYDRCLKSYTPQACIYDWYYIKLTGYEPPPYLDRHEALNVINLHKDQNSKGRYSYEEIE